jgi:signal transduction histidine kinase
LRLSPLTWIYLGASALLAVGMIFYWLQAWPAPRLVDGGEYALFVLLAVLAQHFPLPVGPKRKVDASIAVYFSMVLLFGATAAVILVGLAQLLGQATLALRRNPSNGRRLRAPPEVVFNSSQLVLATGLGALVYFAFLPHQAPAPLARIDNLWALPAAATTMYLANSLAVAGIVGLQLRQDPRQVWLTGRRTHTLEFAGLFLCGMVTAVATLQAGWAPVAMLLLTAILFWSLQRTVQLLAREEGLRVAAQENADSVRRLQAGIEREHATLAAVMASMSDGLLVLDEAGQVRYCNAQAANLLEVDPDSVIGQSVMAIVRGLEVRRADPSVIRVWERMIRAPPELSTGEITIGGPSRRDLLLSSFPIAATSGAHAGLLLRDITIPKQLARLQERERIAMDLHDGVIQTLYGVGMALGAQVRTFGEPASPSSAIVQQAASQIDEVIREIRRTIFDLRPREFTGGSLEAGLAALVAELEINGVPHPALELESGVADLVPPEAVVGVLQIAREATTNLMRHARASQATIRLTRVNGQVVLTISDNGQGFDPPGTGDHPGQGLRNMAERARMLGGTFTVDSAPGQGTEVRLTIPRIVTETS